MTAGTQVKLAAVAIAAAAGVFASQLGVDPEGNATRIEPSVSELNAGSTGAPTPSQTADVDKQTSPASPKGSPLSRALKFERYLATCDLALFPDMLEKGYNGLTQNERSSTVTIAWMKRDPDGYAAWIATQPPQIPDGATGKSYIGIRSSFIRELSLEDPEEAWQMADRLNADEFDKWSILFRTLKHDPAMALRLAEAHPEVYLGQFGGYFGNYASGIDPMQALPVLQALHAGGGRATLADDASNYYAANPDKLDEAAAWFQQLPADAQRSVVTKLERGMFYDPRLLGSLPKLREIWRLPDASD